MGINISTNPSNIIIPHTHKTTFSPFIVHLLYPVTELRTLTRTRSLKRPELAPIISWPFGKFKRTHRIWVIFAFSCQ
jgi:hypothetical protein